MTPTRVRAPAPCPLGRSARHCGTKDASRLRSVAIHTRRVFTSSTVHGVGSFAYLDEADAEPTLARPGFYLITAAVAESAHVEQCEALLRGLLREEDTDPKGHRRLHLSRIKDRHRKNELAAILGSVRGTRFVVAWLSGYTDPKARERVRGRILWDLLPHLATKEQAATILIERREGEKLQAADARTIGRLCERAALPLGVTVRQAAASTAPGLWLADAAAAAWRRSLVEGKQNWSSWYAPHTTLIEVRHGS